MASVDKIIKRGGRGGGKTSPNEWWWIFVYHGIQNVEILKK